MRDEISEHDLSKPRYVLCDCVDDGPNTTIIIPIGLHELKATAEAGYNRINFYRYTYAENLRHIAHEVRTATKCQS